MVEQQIRPYNVLQQSTLDLFLQVDRRDFVSPTYKSVAYCDMSIPLYDNQLMLEPKVQGYIVQSLQVKKSDKILVIGAGTGFLLALLAQTSDHLLAYEINADLVEQANKNLAKYAINKATIIHQDASSISHFDKFDCIAVCGAIATCPDQLKNALKENGRLFYIQQSPHLMSGKIIVNVGNNHFQEQQIIQLHTSPLYNFQEKETFTF